MSKTDTRPTAAEAAEYLLETGIEIHEITDSIALVQGIYGQTSQDAAYLAGKLNGRTNDYHAQIRYRQGLGWHIKVSRYA